MGCRSSATSINRSNNELMADDTESFTGVSPKELQRDLKKELQEAIAKGIVKTKINKDKQAPHRFGSAAYKERVEKGEHPSYFEKSNMEMQKVINNAGTSGIIHEGSPGQYKQIITLEGKYGKFWDRETKQYVSTNRATIHYSKDGTHIVPAYPKEN